MTKAYWIANGEIADAEQYKKYVEANAEAFAAFGARFLVRGGAGDVQEGSFKSRTVVIEFDSYEQALACYNSPTYQKARALRLDVSTINLIIVRGYDGPQPGDRRS